MLNTTKKITAVFTAPRMSVAMAAMLLGTICLLPESGNAQVVGQCVNCHTMHNSQGGVSMSATSTVYQSLTKGDCVGCHTGGPTDLTDNNIPKVNHTGAPASTLAGGSFYWVATAGGNLSATGHNVKGIAGADVLGNVPPGGSALASQLTCAGTTGCHGDRAQANEYTALSGSHHAPNQNAGGVAGAVDGSTLANSYRFLNGTKGIEAADWEKVVSSAAHNQYYGVARTTDATVAGTISALCGQCHGAFHASSAAHAANDVGISFSNNMTSPWVRHPTDFDMFTVKAKEYGDYGGNLVNAYVPQAPVASNSIAAVKSNVMQVAGDAIVTCISCHRAHGSDQADLLRWDYTTMSAHGGTSTSGCFACHTTKDT
ncbi:MAG: cytochrome c3 family protein [Desulfurivibrio sp.]|nr:cytochrome c3 family protein [Desulfurivibrio sp.]MBU3936194.1 hypothetical protein [Pseudomonadota bacterium]MBU4118549.1 hypothetical protein [Pseudomonadota bacterium]